MLSFSLPSTWTKQIHYQPSVKKWLKLLFLFVIAATNKHTYFSARYCTFLDFFLWLGPFFCQTTWNYYLFYFFCRSSTIEFDNVELRQQRGAKGRHRVPAMRCKGQPDGAHHTVDDKCKLLVKGVTSVRMGLQMERPLKYVINDRQKTMLQYHLLVFNTVCTT